MKAFKSKLKKPHQRAKSWLLMKRQKPDSIYFIDLAQDLNRALNYISGFDAGSKPEIL